jgi:type VI secretion system secreted protein VgrG
VAIRGGQGVLISADASLRAAGSQLERDGLNGLAEALKTIQMQLSGLADTHAAGGTDGKPLAQLAADVGHWENGSNTKGGQPVIAVDAPAGLLMGSQANLSIGAQTHVDVVSVGNTQLSAGRKLMLHAMESISLFVHKLGMKIIAGAGKVEIQAHEDNVEITSAKRIVLIASDEIVLQAPKVTIVSQGAQVAYGVGNITYQCTGSYAVKSANVAFSGSGSGDLEPLRMPAGQVKHDQRVRMMDFNTAMPLANQRYRAKLEDGQVVEGTTDAEGVTEILRSSIPFGRYTIEALFD